MKPQNVTEFCKNSGEIIIKCRRVFHCIKEVILHELRARQAFVAGAIRAFQDFDQNGLNFIFG